MRKSWFAATVPIALVALSTPLFAQAPPPDERPVMTALRLNDNERIILDGVLDEEVWENAVPATDFLQQEPNLGQPATERTEVRILYNQRNLYIGVICFDSEPDKILGYQRRRDENLQSDDWFQWTMDTFFTGREGYFFEMNPSGLMADALMTAGGGQNREWDGVWNARAHRSDIGWTLEIEIPFQTLNFDPKAPAWGINFQRTVRRKNEESLWTGYPRNQGLRRMSNAGRLEGIHEVSQGHGLDFKPYITGTAFSAPARGQNDTVYKGDFGGEISYTPTPRLRASLTLNTDFAQTEVDARQVNLGRFSLFFPERRDFFLEGANFFDFRSAAGGAGGGAAGGFGGAAGPRLRPYFSRQIGLNPDGEPQPIVYGARLAGQVGKQDIGILQVRTGEDATSAGEYFSVARLKRRILSQSFIGALFTRRDPRQSGQARNTLGLDFLLDTRRFRTSKNLRLEGFLIGATNQTGLAGGNLAYGTSLSYPNDPWTASFDFREVQPNFDPAIGDVERTDYRRYNPNLTFSPRPRNNRWIRSFTFGPNLEFITDRDNKMLNRDFTLRIFETELNSQDTLSLQINPEYQRIRPSESSKISGITLQGREFSFTRFRVAVTTASRRMISVSPTVEWGPFYSGRRDQFSVNLNVRLRPGLMIFTSTQYNRIRLAEGRVQTRLFRITPEWQMSPFLSLVNTIQYDSVSRVLGWQSRFRWIMRPGNDFYFVYTHDWDDDPITGYTTRAKRVATKVIYTHRL